MDALTQAKPAVAYYIHFPFIPLAHVKWAQAISTQHAAHIFNRCIYAGSPIFYCTFSI